MEAIDNLINRLENYNENIISYLEEATKEAEEKIIDLNIYQLYEYGENRDERKITPEYTPQTVAIKKRKGQPTNRVTLRDTFDFQGSFFIRYETDGFAISASDWKTEYLTRRYGDEILGLQDKHVAYLCESEYIPKLIKELRKAIGYE